MALMAMAMRDATGLALSRDEMNALRHVIAFYEKQGRNVNMRDAANRALAKLETQRAVLTARR